MLAEVCMEEGVVRLESRVARIESDVASLKETGEKLGKKMDRLDGKVDRLDGKVSHLDERLAVMEHAFGGVSENQGRLHVDLRDLRSSLDSRFMWIVTTMIAFGTALLAAMAEGFHWLK
jgi:chromosome segregation ATPase